MKRNIITAGILLFLSFGLQAGEILNIEDCVSAALSQNRDLLITGISARSAQRDYEGRWGALYPGINATAGLDQKDQLFGSASAGSADPLTLSMGLSLSLPLNTGLIHAVEQTRIDYEAGLISYESARKDLIRNVEKEFYYLLSARSNLDLLEKNQELAEKRSRQTRINFANGLSSELAVLQSQVTAAGYKPEISQAKSEYSTRLRSFLILLGMDPEDEIELRGSLEAPVIRLDKEELITAALDSRPDIRAQLNQIDSLENRKKSTRASGYSPTLSLSAGWNSSVNDPLTGTSWESGTWSDSASLGLSLSIPLDGYLPGSADRTALKKSDDGLEQAALTLAKLQDSARMEILNLGESIKTAQETLDQASLNVELSERSYQMTEESYLLGTAERLDVEDAQQALFSARQQYLSSQYSYLAGLIDMKYALDLEDLEALYKLNTREETINE